MLLQLKTALQSIDSFDEQSVEWLWPILNSQPFSPDEIEQSISLLKKLRQLKLEANYILTTLLFFFFPHSKDLYEQFQLPPLVLKNYQTLQTIFNFTPSLRNDHQAELFMKMIIATGQDLQLLSSILAMQFQTLESIEKRPGEEQRKHAKKIFSIYAPLAERLGIFWIKSEMEDIALRYVEREVYYELKQKVAKKREERSQMIEKIMEEIRELLKRFNIRHQVEGRYKRFYSIYKKLKRVDADFERIQDLAGFRILVYSVRDCYKALGYIHDHWSPKSGRFKDYISNPKPNGYQSLHTTVVDKKGESIEIQIRTHKMHEIAEFGVAAHWLYNSESNNGKFDTELYDNLRRKSGSLDESKISVFPRIDLLQNKIYVFTPQHDVIELPKGATSVDFAFAIHSEVGSRITSTKANERILKLHDSLHNGDLVEVTTSPKQTPRQEWLKFVKTSKAKNKIRHAIREHEREINKKVGWELLDKEFKRYQLNLNRAMKDGSLEKMAHQHKNQAVDHVVCTIGEGIIKAVEVVKWFSTTAELRAADNKVQHISRNNNASIERVRKHVVVEGMDNMLVRFAKCCSPEKGNVIQGYLTQGYGITVHRADCATLLRLDENRCISVHWREVMAESA